MCNVKNESVLFSRGEYILKDGKRERIEITTMTATSARGKNLDYRE